MPCRNSSYLARLVGSLGESTLGAQRDTGNRTKLVD